MTGTMAIWMLVAQLKSPYAGAQDTRWNMRQSFQTPEHCQQAAINIWRNYNAYYQGTMTPWVQDFTTTCNATTAHHEYKWFIKCDAQDNCETRKYKGDKR